MIPKPAAPSVKHRRYIDVPLPSTQMKFVWVGTRQYHSFTQWDTAVLKNGYHLTQVTSGPVAWKGNVLLGAWFDAPNKGWLAEGM